jgi:hypothetical protein
VEEKPVRKKMAATMAVMIQFTLIDDQIWVWAEERFTSEVMGPRLECGQ